MNPLDLPRLIREVNEARRREQILEEIGQDLLEQAKAVSPEIEHWVRQVVWQGKSGHIHE
jgi:hypothetical protein